MTNEYPASITCSVTLWAPNDYPTSAALTAPFDVQAVFGTKARVPVKITVDGHTFRSSLTPMGGQHMMVFNKEMRAATGYQAGDTIRITFERDTEPRIVKVPDDVLAALQSEPVAYERFNKLSYSHQKEYMDWINDTRKSEPRQNRIQKLLTVLKT